MFVVAPVMMVGCGGQQSQQGGANAGGKDKDSMTVAQPEAEKSYVPQRADYTFRTDVRTCNNDGYVCWDSIIVYLTDGEGHTRELYSQATPLDTVYWSNYSMGAIEEKDWNFDGIPDLQVCLGPTNGNGNYTYDVWLWDDKVHGFVALDMENVIFDPYVDADNRCIVSTWRLDDNIETVTYKWKDGKLVETERKDFTYGE